MKNVMKLALSTLALASLVYGSPSIAKDSTPQKSNMPGQMMNQNMGEHMNENMDITRMRFLMQECMTAHKNEQLCDSRMMSQCLQQTADSNNCQQMVNQTKDAKKLKK